MSTYCTLLSHGSRKDEEREPVHQTDEIVIAMDCFRGNRPDSLMVKKLAIYNITTEGQGSFHFFPQCPWTDLHEGARNANSFATRYIHDLKYHGGNIRYDLLPLILFEHTDRAAIIYAKGCQNVKFLSDLIGRPVVNIELLMKEMPRQQIEHLKKTIQTNTCLEDHKRKYRTAGFDGEFYACCVDRAYFWAHIVKAYKEQIFNISSTDYEASDEGINTGEENIYCIV
jgi:hypothetical protein